MNKKQNDKVIARVKKIDRLSKELRRMLYPKDVTQIKCLRCNKSFITKNGNCFDCLFGRFHFTKMGKYISYGATGSDSFTIQTFPDSEPRHFCTECNNYVTRCIGFIPSGDHHKYFPEQLYAWNPVKKSSDILKRGSNRDSKIHYKGKKYPASREKFLTLLKQACREYIKKYPEFPHGQTVLFEKLKNHNYLDITMAQIDYKQKKKKKDKKK